ncbi:hypothetical protein [uncultured Roseovarius sp.]|uniref:hypothetical protein n=1 Tax=Roseovarius sp. TaxID=1486281 RepID=UPI0025D9EC02|nr:hypothetical protein [uncultured Roseovarius sp.]
MSSSSLSPELESRLEQAEREAAERPAMRGGDWLFLLASGVVFPVLLLIWGWM